MDFCSMQTPANERPTHTTAVATSLEPRLLQHFENNFSMGCRFRVGTLECFPATAGKHVQLQHPSLRLLLSSGVCSWIWLHQKSNFMEPNKLLHPSFPFPALKVHHAVSNT